MICVYSIGDPVFVPPVSEEEEYISLTDLGNSEVTAVQYQGVTFELPQFNAGFIIFKIKI